MKILLLLLYEQNFDELCFLLVSNYPIDSYWVRKIK